MIQKNSITSYKEVLRLYSLRINNTLILESYSCARSIVVAPALGQKYRILDYEWYTERYRRAVLSRACCRGSKYCVQCVRTLSYTTDLPSLKHYTDYVRQTKATVQLKYKPDMTMKWSGSVRTVELVDTDTRKQLDVYLFGAVLPYGSCAYIEAVLDIKQESSPMVPMATEAHRPH